LGYPAQALVRSEEALALSRLTPSASASH